jgi:hypothetical protein
VNAGSINGLYTFYPVLNMLFRKTICPRFEDPMNISQFSKNLLAKRLGFAPYLMFIIEDVTNRSFPKNGLYMPIRPNPSKKLIVPPAQITSLPRLDLTPQQQRKANDKDW